MICIVDFCLYIHVQPCTCASVLHMNMNIHMHTNNKTNSEPPNSLSVIRFTKTFALRRGKSYNPARLPIRSGKITIKTMNSTLSEAVLGRQQSGTSTSLGRWKAVPGTSLSGHPLFFFCFLSDEIRNALI